MICRVCGGEAEAPAYEAVAPALTSVLTLLPISTRVFICQTCGHAQCDDLPDVEAFYDNDYRISLDSEDHDQVFAIEEDGTIIYRTEQQARISLELLELPKNALLLDYGAAKAATLRKLLAHRSDVVPHVFDVSEDYKKSWHGWVAAEHQASYVVPEIWEGRFDAVMSHFVIEHVPDPVAFIGGIAKLLKPGGRVLLSMPDVLANPGDMIVADHLNHFSLQSLELALAKGGFELIDVNQTAFPGAFFVTARKSSAIEFPVPVDLETTVMRMTDICGFWAEAAKHLAQQANAFEGRKAAIYGAGFYGSWIYSCIAEKVDVVAFLDRNEHLQGTSHFGCEVILPDSVPSDVEAIFVGLNPLNAQKAIEAQPALQRTGLEHIWLEAS